MDKHKTSFNIDSQIIRALKIMAAIKGKTMTEVLEEAINNYIANMPEILRREGTSHD